MKIEFHFAKDHHTSFLDEFVLLILTYCLIASGNDSMVVEKVFLIVHIKQRKVAMRSTSRIEKNLYIEANGNHANLL